VTRAEDHLREAENEEANAWQGMQTKRQVVLKYRALNKDQVADLNRQEEKAARAERAAREYERDHRHGHN